MGQMDSGRPSLPQMPPIISWISSTARTALLGVADLPTGTYTQMRLILADTPDDSENILGDPHPYANYLITSADEAIELKVPSGFQTGIKLVHSFDVESGHRRSCT